MVKRRPLALVLLAGMGAAGCGSSHSVGVAGGTIAIGASVPQATLLKSVLGIHVGTEASTVQTRLGEPFARVRRNDRQTCWAYHAKQPGTSVDAIDFCIGPSQRVEKILIGVHL